MIQKSENLSLSIENFIEYYENRIQKYYLLNFLSNSKVVHFNFNPLS